MLAKTMESTGIVFAKTEKGREEMAQRSHGLNPAQRRVLILIDGSKDADALADMIPAMVPSGQLGEILGYLLAQGFIVAADDPRARSYAGNATPGGGASRSAQAAAPAAPEPVQAQVQASVAAPALREDPATLRLVKDFMTTTAQTYLGLLSAPLIQRIEQARSAAQLMAVAGQWNMALRDSAQGRRFADPYLEQVKSALTGSAGPALGASV